MRECPSCFSCYDDAVAQCPTDERSTFHSLPGDIALEGKYVLERRLGEGGMGIVYKAHHKFLKTTRAIKIIKPELVGNDASFAKRFHQEAMAAAAIGHPNIISVPDFGFLDEKIPFIVMEFVEGVSLQALMTDQGRFTPEQALEYMQVIASAVAAAHNYGIVHRDLKPLNIMIQPGGSVRDQIRILDFGLAKIKSADLFGSFVGAKTTGIIGSPYYMAPEQWSDEETDKRCDIYSLGIILYQMLMGDVPFKGSGIPAIMKKHLMTPPPQLAISGSGISPELERVVHHALEKEPELRTASVEEFIGELEKAVLRSAPAKTKARGRSRSKTKTGTQRQKANEIAASTESDSLSPLTESREEVVDPVVAQDLNTIVRPIPDLPIENDPVPSQQSPLVSSQSELLRKASEEARRRAEARALLEDSERGDAPFVQSKPPVRPAISQPLPGRVVIGQHSVVGTLFRKRYVVGIIAGVVIVGLIVLFTFVYSQKEPEQQANADPPPPIPAKKPREMVLIEGGTFTMGSDKAGDEQKGEHEVPVKSFYLDKYEVTNAEYAEFIKDTGRPAPVIDPKVTGSYWKPWDGNNPPPGRERWPVGNVSAKDAEAFAAWLSKRDGIKYRLPTEEEWEFAARNGSQDSLFPWGNSWEEGRANTNQKNSPTDVGSFPQGATQTGVQDMIGNVWEWTSSKAHFYNNESVKPSTVNAHVQRGGSYFETVNNKQFHNATDRSWAGNENFKFPTIGFRLARDRE
jgi:eukaryotic-like serine/threonine-protein kinase